MNVKVRPLRIFQVLCIAIGIVALLHIVAHIILIQGPHSFEVTLALSLIDMDAELSIPTWVSQILLLGASLSALLVAATRKKAKQPYYRHWYGIFAILLYMSIDEGSRIHELASDPLTNLLGTGGTFMVHGWVFAGFALVLLVAFLYIKFWLALPTATRWQLFLSAFLYLAGAIGFEIIGGYHSSQFGYDMTYRMLVLAEESLEMLGAAFAIYTFLRYQAETRPDTTVSLKK